MTYLTGEVCVIHSEAEVNFDMFIYSAVYCNVASPPSYTINGAAVAMVAGETLEVIVDGHSTIPSGTDILFLGNPKFAGVCTTGNTQSGLVSTSAQSTAETWQFQNIKTGTFFRSTDE